MLINWGRVARGVLVTVALVMGTVTAGPVSAAAMQPPGTGSGYPVSVTINRASLFQCPAPNCNQGEASRHHDVRAYCRLDNTFQGWTLVINRSNGHVGWIDRGWLTNRPDDPRLPVFALCFGTGTGTRARSDTTLYQCPSVNCNRGQVATTHDVAILCEWWGGAGDTGWRFVLNQTNKHVGFIQSRHLNPDPGQVLC